MRKIETLSGKTFNYIKVLSLSDKRDNQNKILWDCECICGKKLLIRSYSLKNSIISCGCKTNRVKDIALNQKYSTYKRDNDNKGFEWKLSKDEFKNIIQKKCYYCGVEPSLWSPYINKKGEIHKRYINKINSEYMLSTGVKINGIDRLDSTIGYNENNCVPCCTKCNIMKNIYSENNFLSQIKKIYEFKLLHK